MPKMFIALFLFCFFLFLSVDVNSKEFIPNSTKFQQYEQEIIEEPIDYFNTAPLFYYPTLFVPIPVYAPYTYQYLDERERIIDIRGKSTLESPDTYNINANDI